MCARYFGFLLLIWFPGELHAQSEAEPCPAPRLVDGYFLPHQESYPHESKLYYACDTGHKPAVEGWWATSTCQNGKWSHVPQCISEKACIPPTIPHAKYTESSEGWFAEGRTVRATCDNGYEHKDRIATSKCTNGTWLTLPVCEKSNNTCDEPPKIPHAVIIKQGYQELFPQDTEVQYGCERGYVIEGSRKGSIVCLIGAWSDGPTCGRKPVPGPGSSAEVGTGPGPQPGDRGSRPDPGRGSSAAGGTGGGHTTPAGRGTQPGDTGSRPDPGRGSSAAGGTGSGHTTPAGRGTQPGGGGGRGSPTTSDSRPLLSPVETCGTYPVVTNGAVVEEDRMYIKYQCSSYYSQVGPDTVTCYNDGSWSRQPICKDDFCVMTTGTYDSGLQLHENQYLKHGETKQLWCDWHRYLIVRCNNRMITGTRCCSDYNHRYGYCA